MEVFRSLLVLFLLGGNFVSGQHSKVCLCPPNFDPRGQSGFCGHEIIQQRASAKPSTRICQPEFVYLCGSGPNRPAFEVPCIEDQKCIPGSESYYKLKNYTDSRKRNIRQRFCATNEGKTNLLVFTINYSLWKLMFINFTSY